MTFVNLQPIQRFFRFGSSLVIGNDEENFKTTRSNGDPPSHARTSVNHNVNREIIPWAETSPWPFKATVAGSYKRKTGPVAFKSLVTLDKLPFRLGIQVYMEEVSAVLLVFSDGSGQAR